MRYRVLIADDEELERRALRLILGAEGMPELEIVEAANGAEALELVGSGELHAAFLDIRMPGLDGIEAARLLREARPRLPIVFLTAHDSFEYARSALRLRVEDFLLKPASAEEVAAALRRALDPAGYGDGAAAEAKLEGALAYMAQELRAELSAGSVTPERVERYLGLRGAQGGVRAVLALKCSSRGDRGPSALRALAPLAERLLSSERIVALAGAGPETVLCVLLGDPAEGEEELRPGLEGLVSRAREELGAALSLGAAFAAPGGDSASATALAQAALRAAALAGAGRPLVLLTLSSSAGAARRPEGELEGAGAGRRTAFRALELLDARHAEELSLESVSQELGVSPSHLSRLLGRHAGMGFADCLARFRVERAKAYLGSGGISVKEAATMVGFRDPAYFARVFRRFEGESPAEFRSRREEG